MLAHFQNLHCTDLLYHFLAGFVSLSHAAVAQDCSQPRQALGSFSLVLGGKQSFNLVLLFPLFMWKFVGLDLGKYFGCL